MSNVARPKIVECRRMPTEILKRLSDEGKIELVSWGGKDGQGQAPATREWVLENIEGAWGVIVMLSEKVDQEFLEAAGPSLRVVSTMSVGYDHIDLDACKKRGVKVGNTPHVLDDAVAELTLTLALMATRQIPSASRLVREGRWAESPWSPLSFCGPSIKGKTIGFLGFGNISQSLAHLLVPFKPSRIIYTTSKPKPFDITSSDFAPLADGSFPTDRIVISNQPEIGKLAEESDVIFVLASFNQHTKHIVDEAFLRRMKPTAYLVNSSRGPLVDTEALAKAISQGWIAGAGLDVLENEPNIPASHPLLQADCVDKVVILPHIGSATNETRFAMAELAARNILGGVGLLEGMVYEV
ncbi:hypothetical protein IE53DRAFT_389151 [Violaceomyces palustris]|uniref:Uncharacterized protein n=1 Tax=Violaceomyces palustris TaxID=1673888 RepID=A0ACD0NS51_9BASI|nr:hypothetical protein IE53DRAFT_389151 [Violaceomyces palustris]